jgi:hypothetical protein
MFSPRPGAPPSAIGRLFFAAHEVQDFRGLDFRGLDFCVVRDGYTVTALPFSGTTTAVGCPAISAMNLSAVASMIGNEP